MSKAKELVEMIRSALGNDADDLTRRRAINACDQLLAVMSTEAGQPLPIPPAPPLAAQPQPLPVVMPATPAAPTFSPATQMLDALIAKLKAELPSDEKPAEPAPSKSLRIPFVPIPGRLAGTGR